MDENRETGFKARNVHHYNCNYCRDTKKVFAEAKIEDDNTQEWDYDTVEVKCPHCSQPRQKSVISLGLIDHMFTDGSASIDKDLELAPGIADSWRDYMLDLLTNHKLTVELPTELIDAIKWFINQLED